MPSEYPSSNQVKHPRPSRGVHVLACILGRRETNMRTGSATISRPLRSTARPSFPVIAGTIGLVLGGCASKPLAPYSVDTPPLVLTTVTQAGGQDKRGRFREIYCAV